MTRTLVAPLSETSELIPIPDVDAPQNFDAYYDHSGNKYWQQDDSGEWITVTESSLKRHLRGNGFRRTCAEGERLSQIDQKILEIQGRYNISYAGSLAGYSKGLENIFGKRILVTDSPKLIQPTPGEFPMIKALLANLFTDEKHDQLSFVYGWLKIAYESLAQQERRPGQVLVLAGERESGKSLFQNLITEILGDRVAKPYRYMTGGTDFNGELFAAEHLAIEDEVASTDIRARRALGAMFKNFTVNEVQSCHAKNRQALSLPPFWRVTVSVNDEPENLMILPPLDDSLEDKLMLLKVHKKTMPMRTFTMQERKTFRGVLTAELPAFLWFLRSWEIPEEMRSERFGIKHFHHPEIKDAIDVLAPEERLLAIIDDSFAIGTFDKGAFEGTSVQLEKALQGTAFDYEIRKLLYWHNAAGTYLGSLARKYPDRVRYTRNETRRWWRIEPPPELAQAQPNVVLPPLVKEFGKSRYSKNAPPVEPVLADPVPTQPL